MSEAEIARMNEQEHFETLTSDIAKLEGYIRQLETEFELRGHSAVIATAAAPPATRAVSANLRNVFVVHGHDEAA